MQTQTEHHEFRELPLKVSGGTVVARVSGTALWKRKEDGTVILVRDLYLEGEDNSLVEISNEDDLWCIVFQALRDYAKGLQLSRSDRGDVPPLSATPYDHTAPGDLDNAMTEGAPSRTDL